MATVRKAQKRVYLLRANFSKNTPAGTTVQMLVSKAVAQLPKVSGQPDLNETARDSANHGKLRIILPVNLIRSSLILGSPKP